MQLRKLVSRPSKFCDMTLTSNARRCRSLRGLVLCLSAVQLCLCRQQLLLGGLHLPLQRKGVLPAEGEQ